MNKLISIGLLLVLAVAVGFAQVSVATVNSYAVKSAAGDTVVNSKSDTTAWMRVGAASMVSMKYTFADRYSIQNIRVDYRAAGSTVVVQNADTIAAFNSTTDNTTTYREVLLRSSTLNYIPVLEGTFRVITNYLASGNDTGKRFYMVLKYSGE